MFYFLKIQIKFLGKIDSNIYSMECYRVFLVKEYSQWQILYL